MKIEIKHKDSKVKIDADFKFNYYTEFVDGINLIVSNIITKLNKEL